MTFDPTDLRSALKFAAFLRTLDVSSPVDHVEDSGNENGGEGGGTQPRVVTATAHGLRPGDSVELAGTGYDGVKVVEPDTDTSFLIDDTPFASATTGGTWSPDAIS